MKFVCDKCHTRYSISDEKVKGKVLKIRCKTCGNIIVVREQGAESAAAVGAESRGAAPRTEVELPRAAQGGGGSTAGAGAGAPAAQGRSDVEWFVAIKGKQHGPMRKEQLAQLFREGRVHDRSYCWNEDLPGWTRMKELPDFADVIAAGPGAAPAATPPPPPPDDESGAEVVSLEAHRQQRQGQPVVDNSAAAAADPFAAVGGGAPGGPAPGADSAPRESTRVFIMNAGLHNRSKKHRTYAVVASAVFAGLVALGALDYMGVVRIPFLGDATLAIAAKLGDKSAATKKKRRELLAAWEDGEEVDPAAQCKFLGVNCPEKSKRKRRGSRSGEGSNDELGDEFFQTGGPGGSGDIERGQVGPGGKALDLSASDGNVSADIRKRFEGDGRRMKTPKVRLSKAKDTIAVAGSGLEPAQLKKVVTQNMGSVQECIERAAKNGSTVSGKRYLVLLIRPNGRVKAARFKDGPTSASPVGECIRRSAKKWKFPPTAGDEFEVEVPLILATRL